METREGIISKNYKIEEGHSSKTAREHGRTIVAIVIIVTTSLTIMIVLTVMMAVIVILVYITITVVHFIRLAACLKGESRVRGCWQTRTLLAL